MAVALSVSTGVYIWCVSLSICARHAPLLPMHDNYPAPDREENKKQGDMTLAPCRRCGATTRVVNEFFGWCACCPFAISPGEYLAKLGGPGLRTWGGKKNVSDLTRAICTSLVCRRMWLLGPGAGGCEGLLVGFCHHCVLQDK